MPLGFAIRAAGGPTALPTPVGPDEWWTEVTRTIVPIAIPAAQALVVAALTLFVGRRARDLVRRSLKRTRADPGVVLLLGQLAYFAVLGLGAIWVLAILNVSSTGIVATLGVASLAVSLSLQDVLKNLVAGLYLLVEKPFRPGERLIVRTFDGVVESVDARTTTLRTSTGERVLIPNAILFAEVLVNRGPPPEVSDVGLAEEGPADAPSGPARR